MVRGAFRSNSKRKVNYRTSSGNRERYEDRKVGRAVSPAGKPLPGVASGKKSVIKNVAKTHKRPHRPYGGELSSPEMRELLRAKARLSLE